MFANPELYADEDWDEPDDPLFRPKPQWVARVESGLFLSNKQFQAIKDYRRSAKERISELRVIGDNKSRDDIDWIKKNIEKLWDLSFEDSANRRRAKAAAADAERKIKEAAAAADGQ
ncbi:hypothetical protein KJ359_003478 [Pestalotiopsis sp. 9143b]|nr:hypothetical protein KJ359_003478 [Pestalotiopsis sp. 9143b]